MEYVLTVTKAETSLQRKGDYVERDRRDSWATTGFDYTPSLDEAHVFPSAEAAIEAVRLRNHGTGGGEFALVPVTIGRLLRVI